MWSNHIRIAFRNLARNRFYSIVNIGGLAIGLSCFTAILLFVEVEHSFDRFHDRPEDIYRVTKNYVNDDGIIVPEVSTPPALAPALRGELPDVEKVTRFAPNRGRLYLLEAGDRRFYETRVIRADENFFNLFSFEFVKGAPETAFNGVHSVVVTESTARKYFGDEDPVGKIVRMNLNNGLDFIVSAVVKDVPSNSHFLFDFVIPFESTRDATLDQNWQFQIFLTYVKLRHGADPLKFESDVKELFKRHQPTSTDEYFVQPLTDIHLRSKLDGELSVNGDEFNVRIMAIIGVFIILIAAINYVNLVTAQSAKRAKEIGIRKVTGAHRSQLVRQLLIETLLTVAISFLLSLALTTSLLPLTQPLLGYDLYALMGQSNWIRFLLPLATLIIGLLAGIYPALALSSFEPVRVLKGSLLTSRRGIRVGQSLVLFQFVISTGLIIASLIIFNQLAFMNEKDLGFNTENVLMLPNVRGGIGVDNDPAGMLESMRSIPGITNIARGDGVLGANNSRNGVSSLDGNGMHLALNFCRVDYEFLPTLQMKLKEGRNFSEEFATDSAAIILNEAAAVELGLKPPYIGQLIAWDDSPGKTRDLRVIGIVEDFHFKSLRDEITPFGFILEVGNGSTFFLKIQSRDVEATVGLIGQTWTRYFPERPFTYSFQDETFLKQHQYEAMFQKIFTVLTTIAILITCVGMVGLITNLAESKTKEIGIRKVLGATVGGVVFMLTSNFLLLAVIALALTSPIVYYFMQGWLSQFAYRVAIDWQVFALAGVIAIVIALLTAGFQSVKAAIANPVKSLRNE